MRRTLRHDLTGLGDIALTMAVMVFGGWCFVHTRLPLAQRAAQYFNFRHATDFVVTCTSLSRVNTIIDAAEKMREDSPETAMYALGGPEKTGCGMLQLRYNVGFVVESVNTHNGIGIYRVQHVLSQVSYRNPDDTDWDTGEANLFYIRLDSDIPM